jgi:hypothetical protein
MTREKQRLLTPWVVEKADRKTFAYILAATLVPGKDGNLEVLRVALEESFQDEKLPSEEEGLVQNGSGLPTKFGETVLEEEVGDGFKILGMVEEEARVAI